MIAQRIPLLVALLVALFLAGCGEAPLPRAAAPGDWERDCHGKPSPPIGRIDVRVVERPAPDRAVIEARWGRGKDGTEGAVELLVPEGAWILDGPTVVEKPARGRDGVLRWLVEHRTGERLDAVVRLRSDTRHARRAREACVRLAASPRAD